MHLLLGGVRIAVALLPVFCFLGGLILLDSYRLVRPWRVVRVVALGALAAVAGLLVNGGVAAVTGIDDADLSRYLAPLVEEGLKGILVVALILRRRVGFQVDSAILGFGAGAGFAALENLHYLVVLHDPSLPLWVIRGLGTAVMHGSVTAIMAMTSKLLVDRFGTTAPPVFLPGWLLASLLHSVFNHFYLAPDVTTALLLATLPAFFVAVFHLSELRTREWLGTGFDTDAELLELIRSGRVGESRVGHYLEELKARFPPATVIDILCLLRLRLELSIRAKGILIARQAGFTVPRGPLVEEQFAELRYLERSIGPTGRLALKPVFRTSDRELWQEHMLGES